MFAGYVMYPMVSPKLMDAGIIAKVDEEEKPDTENSDNPADGDTDIADGQPVNPDSMPDTPKPDPVTEVKPDPVTPDPVTPDPATPTVKTLTDPEFLAKMRTSIESGKVTEFNITQVKDWRRVGKEEIDGVTYEVGIAQFAANTILGPQKHDAKALFKDGKLVKWVWAVTNSDMK